MSVGVEELKLKLDVYAVNVFTNIAWYETERNT